MSNEFLPGESPYWEMLKYFLTHKYSISTVIVVFICAGLYMLKQQYYPNNTLKTEPTEPFEYCILDRNKIPVKVSENFFNQIRINDNTTGTLFNNQYIDPGSEQVNDNFKASDILNA